MLDKAYAGIISRIGQEVLQASLPFRKRQRTQVFGAVEEQVKCKIDQCISLAFGQGGLKGGEIRSAILIQRTYFPIDDRVRQIAGRPCDRGILGGPV